MIRRLTEKTRQWLQAGQTAYGKMADSEQPLIDALSEQIVSTLKVFGGRSLENTVARFNTARPYIERAGYKVTRVEVSLGLSPSFVATLDFVRMLSPEEKDDLLTELTDKKIIRPLITTLFQAASARERLTFETMAFSGLELDLSILPAVTLLFEPLEQEEAANCMDSLLPAQEMEL